MFLFFPVNSTWNAPCCPESPLLKPNHWKRNALTTSVPSLCSRQKPSAGIFSQVEFCFSLKVAAPLAVLIFWELVISRRKGVDVSTRRIKRQKKVAKVTKAVALMEMKELEAEFRAARKAYRVAKKGHRES